MPDFQQFSITRDGPKSLTVPTWKVELRITDSRTQALVRDFTGANAITFPQVLGQLSAAEQDEFVRDAIRWLILNRAAA